MSHDPSSSSRKGSGDEPRQASINPYLPGLLCHLLALVALLGIPFAHILGPLAAWLVKRHEDRFADACGKESLNFQITMSIALIPLPFLIVIATFIPVLDVVLAPLFALAMIAVILFDIAQVIAASIHASEGRVYRYPVSIRFVG